MSVSLTPTGQNLLSKNGGPYRPVCVCPQVCKSYTLQWKGNEMNTRLKMGEFTPKISSSYQKGTEEPCITQLA